MPAWLVILLLWIAPALALLVVLIRTTVRKVGRERENKENTTAEP